MLVICILGIAIGGISFYATFGPGLFPVSPDFYWGTQVNETLLYEIRAYGDSYAGNYGVNEIDEILALNQSRVLVTITSLPNLSSVVDSVTFENTVIQKNKVSCTFENGSNLPSFSNGKMARALSGCILPLGDWSLIDSFYIDQSPGWVADQEFIIARLHADYLFIGWEWSGSYDDSGGWYGNVRLTDGIPTQAIWHYYHLGTIYLELNLID